MQDPLLLGGVLFGLFAAPFLTYMVVAWLGRRDLRSGQERPDRTPSTTGAHPSRTIPGGGSRREK